ncbi:helix-turn-helix transcriptional regulator [uncultured Aeromicrobium sp.]|uniref:ArsR/SmtB family transcription factor n=1 Tax=uncultured Aeromicrobium sp. TaxID=337820 RepID=UPI0025E4DF92|nr:metalloregulator ArsR/SmtB family transcription factor [uncultured Aeromicrobium sp.]
MDRHAPLYEIKANLFKALAHPVRIRVLELLTAEPEGEVAVSELLAATDLEASHLSQHLSVLRRHRVVTSRRAGSSVLYRPAHPRIVDLLLVAREFLHDTIDATQRQREELTELPALRA